MESTPAPARKPSLLARLAMLFDSYTVPQPEKFPGEQRTSLFRWLPYLTLHAGCLGVIWTGWSLTAVIVAVVLYFGRMFAITGIYHRYFSHRTYTTSRFTQFLLALWGNAASQRGPIWWAAQHRHHHTHSDTDDDVHSPVAHGVYWSHVGWLTATSNLAVNWKRVPDLAKYPELRFLDRYDLIVPLALIAALFGLGEGLRHAAPGLGTTGLQMVVWGFFISTTALFHATCCINSLAHLCGTRRYETTDHSRNNWFLALMTMGEGWHNNHHHYPGAARQGFFWWEIDLTYYVLLGLQKLGIIWDVRAVPERELYAFRKNPAKPLSAKGRSTRRRRTRAPAAAR